MRTHVEVDVTVGPPVRHSAEGSCDRRPSEIAAAAGPYLVGAGTRRRRGELSPGNGLFLLRPDKKGRPRKIRSFPPLENIPIWVEKHTGTLLRNCPPSPSGKHPHSPF